MSFEMNIMFCNYLAIIENSKIKTGNIKVIK